MSNRLRLMQPLHADAAARARAEPGTWVLANVYETSESGQATVRTIRSGNGPIAYRPAHDWEAYAAPHTGGAAVWVRHIAGLAGLEPMPETLTVRVADYRTQPGYQGVRVASVVVSAKCVRCGGPRGRVSTHHFLRRGRHIWCDIWENRCGHADEYGALIEEAERLKQPTPPQGSEIKGVEGGEFAPAVDLIAGLLKDRPRVKAHVVAAVLAEAGHTAAAEVIRAFIGMTGVGRVTSAQAAACYLVQCDMGLHPSAPWTDGRIAYGFETNAGSAL